jgi:DNA-binding NtrC family response regulator
LLPEYFLQRITRKNGMARIRISAEATTTLQTHHWPGNVRELENTIARACALASSSILLPADIPLASSPRKSSAGFTAALDQLINAAPTDMDIFDWISREISKRILERADGDIKEAAKTLHLPISDLRKLLAPKE